MTADDEYSVPTSEKLPQPIQMQLSKKEKCFGQFFATCLITISNFQNVQKKYDPYIYCVLEIRDCKGHG